MSQGPASLEAMHDLHRLLSRAIKVALRSPSPSAEELKVALRFVEDYCAPVPLDEVELRAVRRIRRALLVRLAEAMTGAEKAPSASLLAVAQRVSAEHKDALVSPPPPVMPVRQRAASELPFAEPFKVR